MLATGKNSILRSRTQSHFDFCILDEASQVTEPLAIAPLRLARRFLLAGDHQQLPPLVRNSAARQGGMDISLFQRLHTLFPQAAATLTLQYRMNASIVAPPSELVYAGQLRCATQAVASGCLDAPCASFKYSAFSLEGAVVDPACALCVFDTDALREARESFQDKAGESIAEDGDAQHEDGGARRRVVCNLGEVDLVERAVVALLASGAVSGPEEIGVISPYRAQVALLTARLASHKVSDVHTIDRFQGREKRCVVVSLVRSNAAQDPGALLTDDRRINVALTRAKHKLVVVGSRSTVRSTTLLAAFFKFAEANSALIQLPDTTALAKSESTQARKRGGQRREIVYDGEDESFEPDSAFLMSSARSSGSWRDLFSVS